MTLSSLIPKRFVWSNRPRALNAAYLSRVGAFVLLVSYLAIAVAVYNATSQQGSLGLHIGLCDETPCVTWVMPAGHAWHSGARPGMSVVSVDGQSVGDFEPGLLPSGATSQAELRDERGEVFAAYVIDDPIAHSGARFSLWFVGGMFVALGSTVLLRRPDLRSAWWFAAFSCAAAAGLAVGPASGGPQPPWALVVTFLALAGIGASCFPFVVAMVSDEQGSRQSLVSTILLFVGLCILAAYALSVSTVPSLYGIVQPVLGLYLSISLLGAIGVLAVTAVRQRSPVGRLQSRIALFGIGLGTLPFLGLTIIPDATGVGSFIPSYVSVLAVGLIPIAFAYAILQHHLLGIRKLVHRGMVYGITTLATLAVVAAGTAALTSSIPGAFDDKMPLLVISLLVTGGVVAFLPLRRGVRWVVDRLFYGDIVHYEEFVDVLKGNELTSGRTNEVIGGIARRLLDALGLESAVLYLGEDASDLRLASAVGPRADEVVERLFPLLEDQIRAAGDRDMIDLRWEADSLLILNLRSSGRPIGVVILGPKEGGEVFVEEEKSFVATVAPHLALAVDQSILSSELRELNQRLLKAQEQERARVAVDLHDGPLQKAILLARARGRDEVVIDPIEIARDLVSELREISSRLRPSILDDLGLVSAIDWLLDAVSKRTMIATSFSLNRVEEDDRFDSERELALFRVTQEAINNAVKHSEASNLDVSLSRDDDELVLLISDDGVGFSSSTYSRTTNRDGGVGLGGMRERVVHLDGSLEISSAPGSGTTILARVPIEDGISVGDEA